MKSKIPFYFAICATVLFTGCGKKKLTAEELAREVFKGIRDNDMGRLKAMAMPADEFRKELEKRDPDFKAKPDAEKKKMIEDDLRHRLTTIEEDAKSIRRQFCDHGADWSKAIFTRSFHKIDTADNAEFSAILISFEYNRRLEYFEVECIKTKNGWKIFDDLSSYALSDANQEFIERLHPVPAAH